MLLNQRILLIIAGGIAAYKSLELIRRLRERGCTVRCVLTRAGSQFVTPLSVASLSEDKAYSDLFSLTDESEMGHIRLSREADLIVVAPATANILAKMASGMADDLASTALLATDKPVLVAPGMNVEMWNNPATLRNVACLKRDGVRFVGPDAGDLACGEVGVGRMAEVVDIIAAIETLLSGQGEAPLRGRRALVTAGATREPIDPVRYISNHSSGKQGYAIADALSRLGAHTILATAPTALDPPRGVEVVKVETADEMMAACRAALPVDVAILTAAVADWRVANRTSGKLKKTNQTPVLNLVENPDILATLSQSESNRPHLVVGFAAETENLVANATTKLARKGCDWLMANDVSGGSVFGKDDNIVHLITSGGSEAWPKLSKIEVAARLATRVAEYFVNVQAAE